MKMLVVCAVRGLVHERCKKCIHKTELSAPLGVPILRAVQSDCGADIYLDSLNSASKNGVQTRAGPHVYRLLVSDESSLHIETHIVRSPSMVVAFVRIIGLCWNVETCNDSDSAVILAAARSRCPPGSSLQERLEIQPSFDVLTLGCCPHSEQR